MVPRAPFGYVSLPLSALDDYLSGSSRRSKQRTDDRGFTLIELLIVVTIIAILAAILVPNFLRNRTNAQVAASKTGIRNLATALEVYYVDNRAYPTDVTLSVLVSGGYTRAVPSDACTQQAYIYAPTGASYVLQTQSWSNNWCSFIANGLSWTPNGGLVQY